MVAEGGGGYPLGGPERAFKQQATRREDLMRQEQTCTGYGNTQTCRTT